MASAEVALREHERAFERQATVRKEMDRQAVVLDWYIRMLSDLCLTEILLAKGELTAATAQAKQFVDAPASIASAADAPWSAEPGSLPFRVLPAGDVPYAKRHVISLVIPEGHTDAQKFTELKSANCLS